MFSDSLDEFDSSKETVMQLIDEYKACESPEYINYGIENISSDTKEKINNSGLPL